MTAPVVPITDCVTGSGDQRSGDALAVFVSRPQVVKITAAAAALCPAASPGVNSRRGTPIHHALKPMWGRMSHEGTPTFYALKRVTDRMPHKGTPTFYGLKPMKDRMPA